jgi:hypothetical protein
VYVMWINDLHVIVNVDNQPFANLLLPSLLAVRHHSFFPYPRVEKSMNSQECGGAISPRNDLPRHGEIMWKTGAVMAVNNLHAPANAV